MKKKEPPRCDIALLVDEETGEYGRGGRFIPEDDDVEEKVLRALRRNYQRVEVVPFSRKADVTVQWLRRLKPRIVMNLTEWVDGDRRQDAAIAERLDALKLRYTGPGPEGLRRARDKALSKRIVAKLGVPVPRDENGGPGYPLIVKPRYGDASEGISNRSVVNSLPALRERMGALRRRLRQPVLREEFIPGRDLYVGLLGNEPRVLPPVELDVLRKSIPSCRSTSQSGLVWAARRQMACAGAPCGVSEPPLKGKLRLRSRVSAGSLESQRLSASKAGTLARGTTSSLPRMIGQWRIISAAFAPACSLPCTPPTIITVGPSLPLSIR